MDVCGLDWGWLPASVALLLTVGVLITYTVAVICGHVDPFFPYFRDVGSEFPESVILTLFLNMAAWAGVLFIVVKYKLITNHLGERDINIKYLAIAELILLMIAAFGTSMGGNFKNIPIHRKYHLVAWLLVFFCGGISCVVETVITYKMAEHFTRNWVFTRLTLMTIAIVGFACTMTGYLISGEKTHDLLGKKHWGPNEPGYTEHLISTFGEWTLLLAIILYFLVHASEFRTLHVDLQVYYISTDQTIKPRAPQYVKECAPDEPETHGKKTE